MKQVSTILTFALLVIILSSCKTEQSNKHNDEAKVKQQVNTDNKLKRDNATTNKKIEPADAESIKRYCDKISLAKNKGELDNLSFNLEFPNIAGDMNGYTQDGKLLLMELYAEKDKQILKNSYFFKNEKPVRVIFHTFNYEGLIEVNKGNLVNKEINEFFFEKDKMVDWVKNNIDHVSPINARFIKKEKEIIQEITTMRAMLKM